DRFPLTPENVRPFGGSSEAARTLSQIPCRTFQPRVPLSEPGRKNAFLHQRHYKYNEKILLLLAFFVKSLRSFCSILFPA
ncbi:MAG: hypothetical protein PUG83_00435, partial [Clostridiaceae bacterium]|nr:hypothetical protein [Clostridiaceae bacterium]